MSQEKAKKQKNSTKRPLIILMTLIVLVIVGFLTYGGVSYYQAKSHDGAYEDAQKLMGRYEWQKAYDRLKAVENQASEDDYQFYTAIATAAYMSKHKEASLEYAKIGSNILRQQPKDTPPEDPAIYNTSVVTLTEIQQDTYIPSPPSSENVDESKRFVN